jgi:hypothetical protein
MPTQNNLNYYIFYKSQNNMHFIYVGEIPQNTEIKIKVVMIKKLTV